MTKGVYKAATSESKWKGIIKYALYIIIAGLIAYYMKDSIDGFAEYWNIPLRGDLLVTFVAIAIGMLSTTFLLYFYERSVRNSGGRFNE